MATPPQSKQEGKNAGAGASYFVDQRKGEVNELKALLKNLSVERDMQRKRDVIKKAIALMTLGIDVSRLFTEMIMAIEIKDVICKKLIYLYLCHYAHTNPDSAIMCINTMHRDCSNEDPMIRGLALRSLCSLRLSTIIEYVEQPLQKSLTDISAYVRKTGVMGILKLYHLDKERIRRNLYIDKLYSMLDDVDPQVIVNVIMVLDEMSAGDGGMKLDKLTILSLLKRLNEFSEWGLGVVLDLVCRYKPSGEKAEDETFAIMNLLDPILRTSNSSAVLATMKCFIHLLSDLPDMHENLYLRTKDPILTLISCGMSEIQYVVLKHVELLLNISVAVKGYQSEYRHFFLRHNEPGYVKHLKLKLISTLATDYNAHAIAEELREYVTDVDEQVGRLSVRAIANIAVKVKSVAKDLTSSLIEFIDLGFPFATIEAIRELVNVFRVHNDLKSDFIISIARFVKKVKNLEMNNLESHKESITEALGALLWMLGEFAELISEAPYIIETFIDSYDTQASALKNQLLIATLKTFFKRPPETQAMLGRLLNAAVNDSSHQDVHDRALLYYRLLSGPGPEIAKSLFNSQLVDVQINGFAESDQQEFSTQVLDEFNTLAAVYGVPSVCFIADDYTKVINKVYGGDVDMNIITSPSSSSSSYNNDAINNINNNSNNNNALNNSNNSNLLDFGRDSADSDGGNGVGCDLLGLSGDSASANSSADIGAVTSPGPTIEPSNFQELWCAHSDAYNGPLSYTSSTGQVPPSDVVESALSQVHVVSVAVGALPSGGLKFFMYAYASNRVGNGDMYLLQLCIESNNATVIIKNTNNSNIDVGSFKNILSQTLQTI